MLQSWVFWISLGYLSGAIPFAWIIASAHGVNLSQVGSGNIGATNVGRALGRKWGVLCFVLDLLKGLIPVLAAGWAMDGLASQQAIEIDATVRHTTGTDHNVTSTQAWGWLGVAIATIVGHMYPVWLGFKGGKGVATGLGAMLGLWPVMTIPALIAAVLWILTVKVTRYVSLASILAAVSIPVTLFVVTILSHADHHHLVPFFTVTKVMAALVIVRHRTNIARLLAGTESKIGSKLKNHDSDQPLGSV